jgi:two-component system chemotaxis sensor kinase CheA
MDDLLADFLTETNESLAELDTALVKLERIPNDRETLSLIFRLVHTIKGTCGFLGLSRLERVAHAAENVLGRVRDGALAVTPDIVSQVLAAIDRIKLIVGQLANSGAEPPGDDSALIAALDVITAGDNSAEHAAGQAAEAPEPEPAPTAEPASPVSAPVPVAAPMPSSGGMAGAAAAPVPAGEASTQQTIRVTVDVLEDLMTLVSELVLTRNQLLQLARAQENGAFTVPLQRLSHITSDLQEGVMKTRMQPIGNAWNKLPRLVRDLARDLDKRIDIVMLGAETELDRQVLELIKDPLTHMVRNSGDHGLETPAERRAAGKPETGQIRLNAFHEGGHIIIEIADDGRGLSLDRIRAKALAAGLTTEAELAAMSDEQVQRFIFRAGFSTAAAVTAVSGRGVGMDVVKTNIERIGGTIEVRSIQGAGSTFTIKIPLTLAIVSALIVEAGNERFAIPQISVMELVRADAETNAKTAGDDGTTGTVIERINDTPVLRLRDRLLPLVNLNALLRLNEGAPAQGGSYIVVTQVGASTLGIIVDRVFDTEEIVVKPVAPILRHITMFSGNTILGDGSVIMILDPNGIARASGVGASSDGNAADRRTGMETAFAARRSGERTAMLLFRAGGHQPIAVPLGLVARLESVPRERIESSCGMPVTQYRGRLMPLVPMAPPADPASANQQVLVFTDRGRCMGLMVDEIVDVVEDVLKIELGAARPGLLGSAVIAGMATDVVDTGYWLMQAWNDWFQGVSEASSQAVAQVLVVEDSDFFRQLLVPALSAAGYGVTAASSAAEALALRDAGRMFDAVVSDIEMPDMDGFQFARRVRAEGPWSDLPLVALSGRSEPRDAEAARAAGFTEYVAKFQRDALLDCLRSHLGEPGSGGSCPHGSGLGGFVAERTAP